MTKGPGYFRLNNSLLLDKKYKSKIKAYNLNGRKKYSMQSKYTIGGYKVINLIRNETIRYASQIKKTENENE
jgi:hypothetical protein